MFFDSLNYFAEFQSDALGFDGKLIHFAPKELFTFAGPRVGNCGDDGSDAGTRFQPLLLNQMLNNFVRGVGMNFKLRGEQPDGREVLAGTQFAADDGFLRGENQLVENGFAGLKRAVEKCHRHTVTRGSAIVKHLCYAITSLTANILEDASACFRGSDAERTHFAVEMAAFEAERLRGLGHVPTALF